MGGFSGTEVLVREFGEGKRKLTSYRERWRRQCVVCNETER
jgi:hypothetical protein